MRNKAQNFHGEQQQKYNEFSNFLQITNIYYLILFPEVIHVILLILTVYISIQNIFRAI